MSSKVSAVFRIILKVLKYCLIALVLLFVDEMCMKRDYASMPACTADRALSQYSIYSPKVFAAGVSDLKQLKENCELGFSMQNLNALTNYYVDGFFRMPASHRLALSMPLLILLFVVIMLVLSRRLKTRSKNFKFGDNTKGQIVKGNDNV